MPKYDELQGFNGTDHKDGKQAPKSLPFSSQAKYRKQQIAATVQNQEIQKKPRKYLPLSLKDSPRRGLSNGEKSTPKNPLSVISLTQQVRLPVQ